MSLPAGFHLYPDHGRRTLITQRGYWTLMRMPDGDLERHYTSCMLASLAMLLEKAGIDVPTLRGEDDYAGTDPRVVNAVLKLHRATGRPLYEGTTIQDSMVALHALFGNDLDDVIHFGTMNEQEMRAVLYARGSIRISVRPLTDMPHIWRIPAGYNGSGHALVTDRPARRCYGQDGADSRGFDHSAHADLRELHIVDPMFRPSDEAYTGQWLPMDKLLSYADRFDGEYVTTWTERSAALA